MLKTTLGRFRLIGLLEGLSFLVLLFIAMPLKYFAGLPLAVKVVGWAHGLLFVLFLRYLVAVAIEHRWSFARVLAAFAASLLPFGTLVFDRSLRREEQAAVQPAP